MRIDPDELRKLIKKQENQYSQWEDYTKKLDEPQKFPNKKTQGIDQAVNSKVHRDYFHNK